MTREIARPRARPAWAQVLTLSLGLGLGVGGACLLGCESANESAGPSVAAPEYAGKVWRPKGPSEVVDVQALAIPAGVLPPLRLEGVDYISNIDVKGVLVLEIRDVSVGKIHVSLAFGEHEGRFCLAGMRPKS